MQRIERIWTSPADPTGANEALNPDTIPYVGMSNQETYQDGYCVIQLARGGHYTIPVAAPPLSGGKELASEGFGLRAMPRCIIEISSAYSLILFDRGTKIQDVAEPLVALPKGKTSQMVNDRYFLVDKLGYVQVGVASGSGSPAQIEGVAEMCLGSRLVLGRSYASEMNRASLPSTVSEKHAAIDIDFAGNITVIDCASTNGTVVTIHG